MATATEPQVEEAVEDVVFPISSDVYAQMVEAGLIPEDRRVYLWDGRLYEKMAKTRPHVAVHNALMIALVQRTHMGYSVGTENPIRLDERHTPLPDLVMIRGGPLSVLDLNRYFDGNEVETVAEVAVTSLPRDLGPRLARYALSLPNATYVVADVKNRRFLVHTVPRAEPAGYAEIETVGPGQSLRLRVGGVDLAPIPFEDVMR